jgi:uncharacterized protein (TIGR03086 family)
VRERLPAGMVAVDSGRSQCFGGVAVADIRELHHRALDNFSRIVGTIGDTDWNRSTPCSDWDVRELLNHVTGENLWAEPLFAGKTVAEVGTALDGDLLGHDPAAAWRRSAEIVATAATPEAIRATVHLSFGDFPGAEYLGQLLSDLVLHGWDLATAVGTDPGAAPDLVAAVYRRLDAIEPMLRASGQFGRRLEVPAGADQLTRLLALAGRSSAVDALN